MKVSHIAIAAIVAGIIGAAYELRPWEQAQVVASAPPPARTPQVMSYPSAAPAPVAAAPVLTAPATLSKYQLIVELKKSADPRKRYQAYKIVKACIEKREPCGDISEGQKTAQSYLQDLNAAAADGVWGAGMDVLREGPLGMAQFIDEAFKRDPNTGLLANPISATVARMLLDWEASRQPQITASLSTGDPEIIHRQMMDAAYAKDWPRALSLAAMAEVIYKDQAAKPMADSETRRLAERAPGFTERLRAKSGLPPEEADAAIREGQQLARQAQTSPNYGGHQ